MFCDEGCQDFRIEYERASLCDLVGRVDADNGGGWVEVLDEHVA